MSVSPSQRVPDFFIVGHPKSGTTALYQMLRCHPQIYMPDYKEPWFFAPDMHPGFPTSPHWSPRTLEEYLALFVDAEPEQRIGEASSTYLRSSVAASAIAQLRPDARIIAILREPASFLRSLHLQQLRDRHEDVKDLRLAIELEPERRAGRKLPRECRLPQMLLYSEHLPYVQLLRRYHAVFPADQVMVLIYDDFRHDNEITVRSVLRFLEVDEQAAISAIKANVTTGGVRSQKLDDVVQAVSVGTGRAGRLAKAGAKMLMPSKRIRRAALQIAKRDLVYRKPSPPDEELMFELRKRFKDEVVALSEYLGRDLVTLWGYDGVP